MAEYIERERLLRDPYFQEGRYPESHLLRMAIREQPAADVVEVDKVAEMFYEAFGDPCACNYNDNDEWLSAVCDYDLDECPDPKDPLGCWKQFIKHYGERRNDAAI